MSLDASTRTRLTTAAILALVLGTGVALGVAFAPRLTTGGETSEVEARRTERATEDRGLDRSGRRRPLIVEQVGLSDTQKAQVDSIVTLQRARMRALQEEFDQAYMPRYRELIQETREAVRGVLTPDQRIRYDSLLADHDRRRQDRRGQEPDQGSGR